MKTATAIELRALAAWYREYAKRAGNPTIWDARLRTAEDLEAEAERIEIHISARAEGNRPHGRLNSANQLTAASFHGVVDEVAHRRPAGRDNLSGPELSGERSTDLD